MVRRIVTVRYKTGALMRLFLAVLFLIVATSAHAIVGPMVFSPTVPNSNDSFTVSVRTGPCEVFGGGGTPQVQVMGNVIKITSLGISNTEPVLCFFPISIATFTVEPVLVGAYTVELYLRPLSLPTLSELVQTGSVNITQGVIILRPVPISSLYGLVFLLGLLCLTGIIGIGKHP